MRNGVHGVVVAGEHGGPGIIILFAGAAFRLLLAVLGCYSEDAGSAGVSEEPGQEGPLQTEGEMTRNEKIGHRGESHVCTALALCVCITTNRWLQIHKWLQAAIPGWSYEHWTSKLRSWDGYPPFMGNESLNADFTYYDGSGRMREVLLNEGVWLPPHWSNRPTYHLEVKSTPRECNAPLFVSENQIQKVSLYEAPGVPRCCTDEPQMQYYEQDPNNAYILVRVFQVERANPGVQFFPNPWNLKRNSYLDIGERRPDGSYPVYIGR